MILSNQMLWRSRTNVSQENAFVIGIGKNFITDLFIIFLNFFTTRSNITLIICLFFPLVTQIIANLVPMVLTNLIAYPYLGTKNITMTIIIQKCLTMATPPIITYLKIQLWMPLAERHPKERDIYILLPMVDNFCTGKENLP